MRWFVAGLCVLATLLLIAASMNMNWNYWSGQGANESVGLTLGLVSIGIDLFKATLPLIVAWSWHERRWLGVGVGCFFLVLCLAFSLTSALGFASTSRGVSSAKREDKIARRAELQVELTNLRTQIAQLKNPRPKSVLDELLAKLKQDRRWATTNECREPANEAGRSFCKEMGDLRIEMASAAGMVELTKQRDGIEAQLTTLESSGALVERDSQAALLSRLTGIGVEPVTNALTSLLSLAVEFGAAFGLYFASIAGGGRRPSRQTNSLRAEPVPQRPLPVQRQVERMPKRLVRGPDGHLMVE